MQITYNGAQGPQIVAGGLPFTAGEPTEVAEEVIAASLLAKPYFSTPVPVKVAPVKKEE
jgi:hypothetical protein